MPFDQWTETHLPRQYLASVVLITVFTYIQAKDYPIVSNWVLGCDPHHALRDQDATIAFRKLGHVTLHLSCSLVSTVAVPYIYHCMYYCIHVRMSLYYPLYP